MPVSGEVMCFHTSIKSDNPQLFSSGTVFLSAIDARLESGAKFSPYWQYIEYVGGVMSVYIDKKQGIISSYSHCYKQ